MELVKKSGAGLVDRFNVTFPRLRDGFDSRIPLSNIIKSYMKITICGSIAFFKQMQEIKKQLENAGHIVEIPPVNIKDEQNKPIPIQEYYNIRKKEIKSESWVWERKQEAMRKHFNKVAWAEGVLVLNYTKNNIEGYVGANTLIEMGLAFHLNKKIYLLNPVPELSYKEEILGMHPTVTNGDISLIS